MFAHALLVILTLSAPSPADPVRVILRALEATDPEQVASAEGALKALPKQGTAFVLGTYSGALMRVSQKRYDDAEKLLGELSVGARSSPPILRLQFWLAWQKCDAERTWSLAESLLKQVEQAPADDSETQQTVDWLAEFIAATEVAGEHSVITAKQGMELKHRLARLESSTLKNRVKQHYQRALRRCAELQKRYQEAEMNGEEATTAALEGMRTEFNQQSAFFQGEVARRELAEEENRKWISQNTKERAAIAGYERQLAKWWNEPTAGHPGIRPSPPGHVSRGKDDSDSEYRSKLEDQREKEEEYERKVKAYERKLNEWEETDRSRRGKIEREKLLAEQKKKESLEAKMSFDSQRQRSDAEFHKLREEFQLLQTNLNNLDIVKRAVVGTRQLLFTPEPLGMLSMSTERGRISAVLLKASKPMIEDSEPDLLIEK